MNKIDKTALVPKYRFPEFESRGSVVCENGNLIFEPISNKNHNSDLPVLAITQEHGAIPREEIDYTVSVSKKGLENYKVVEKGDFIISLRSFQGGIEYSMHHGICSPAYIILRKKVDIVDQYYKHYFKSYRFIQDLNKDLEGIRDGKMVSYNQFSAILLPKPDKEEQQKIADCLSSLDELISAEDKKLTALKEHKKGLMQKLFPAEGKTLPEWRFPEFNDCGEWKCKLISEISNNIIAGGTPSTAEPTYWNGDIRWMNSGELNLKRVHDVVGRITELGLKKSSTKLLPPRCILIGLAGQGKTRGTVAINMIETCINQSIAAICPNEEVFDSNFLYHYLDKEYLTLRGISAGDGERGGLNLKLIKSFKTMLPMHIDEQQKIADALSSVDNLITAQSEKIEALKEHKKGLMQGLFPSIEEVSQ